MKKFTIIFALFCVSAFASAQLNTLYEQYPQLSDGALSAMEYSYVTGRHYTVSASEYIIYITDFGQFYTAPPTGPYTVTKTLKVKSGYIISDITVFAGRVYFCGKKITGSNPITSIGFIGWFTIFNIDTTSVVDVNYSDIPDVSRVDKIITYPAPMVGQKVVAISETDYPNPGDAAKRFQIIESNYDGFSDMLINVRIGELWNDYPNSNNIEVAHEVLKSTDFIAIVGYNTMHNALSVRRCDPNNVLTYISSPFYYPSTTHPVLSRTHSTVTHANDNILYISYLTNSFNEYFSACIREIKLSSMYMIGSQELPLHEKTEPLALEYPDSTSAPTLLMNLINQDSTVVSTNFIKLSPHCISDYIARRFFKTDIRFQTSCINSVLCNDIYAASNEFEFLAHDMSYWGGGTQDCPTYEKIEVKYVRPEPRQVFTHFPTVNTMSLTKTVFPTPYYNIWPNNSCVSQ